jgi:Flp pilus assembly protein TadD
MSDLDYKLAHGLNAVLGWLELGNTREARLELDALPSSYADRTEVMDLRWLLHARESDWDGALAVAERLVALHPEDSSGWLHRAYAIRRVPAGGLTQATELLRPAFEKFPSEPTIPFNLACYACQLGELEDARRWLREAFKRGDEAVIKGMALADRDLETLWAEIRSW